MRNSRRARTKAKKQYEDYLAVKKKEIEVEQAKAEQEPEYSIEEYPFDCIFDEGEPSIQEEPALTSSNPSIEMHVVSQMIPPEQAEWPPIPAYYLPPPPIDEEEIPAGNVKALKKAVIAKQPHRNQRNISNGVIGGLSAYGMESGSYGGSLSRNIGRGSLKDNYVKYGTLIEPTVRTEVEECEVLPGLEASEAKLPSDIEQFDEVRDALKLIRSSDRTLVYCVVVDKKNEKNVISGLRCYGGVAFGGYARDVSGDVYLVECVQAAHLGHIPFSFKLEMPKTGNWSVNIPIPEKVLEGAFAPSQRKTLSDLRDKFPDERFEFQYLQMLMVN